jgi:hypothetical protein
MLRAMAKAKKKAAARGTKKNSAGKARKAGTARAASTTRKSGSAARATKGKKPVTAKRKSLLPSKPAKAVETVVKAVKAAVKAVKRAVKIVNSTPGAIKPVAKSKPASKPAANSQGAPKKAARAGVPAQSPMKGMPIDAWISSAVTGWQATTIRALIDLVREVAPESKASIKWGQPVFESNGPFAYIKPAKTHVTFGFWRGVEIGDERGLLHGEGERMKHIKVAPGPLDTDVLTGFVREAVELNRSKGDPTKRDDSKPA